MQQQDHGTAAACDLLDITEVCAFFGGSKPLHLSTIYRGIGAGRYPRPVPVGAKTVRWLRSECEATLRAMIDARDVA
jgi:predicted DNA-binding transcriptional regulator AlpA